MTSSTVTVGDWVDLWWGKAARATLFGLGMVAAVMSMLLGVAIGAAAWVPIVLGLALAANTARAATVPSVSRIAAMAANLVVIVALTAFI